MDEGGDWFMLGVHHQLLLEQCLALKRKFSCEHRCFRMLSAGLRCDLSEGLYHARNFLKSCLSCENSTRDYEREVNKWCGIASHFLENRNNYFLLTRTGNDKTSTKDRQWPPEPLLIDWFDFEKSFDILAESQRLLWNACSDRGIDYPENEEAICLSHKETDECTAEEQWQLLKEENRVEEGKEKWQNLAVIHLRDLMTHQQDLLFLK